MMGILRMIVVGAIVGILARFFYQGRVPIDLVWSVVLGIAGSFVAGLAVAAVSPSQRNHPLHAAGFVASILGAMVLIFLARHIFHWV